ncbi:MAG: hypothetical protein GAK45_00201 [Pseudomonas citronellolis]|nr:MAG: hypothetical protein GAK45_00201 [Pseudomonas citronellolis]
MNSFLLLEPRDDLLLRIAQISVCEPQKLFAGTELALYKDDGPLWVPADAALLAALQEAPEQWPGLILQSSASETVLLSHLRHILLIRFDEGQRKGVLRYWSPRSASYLFLSGTPEDRQPWLGPIDCLRWHGGTWRESAEGRQGWREQPNALAASWVAPPPPRPLLHLLPSQEEALERQECEYFVQRWHAQHPAVTFGQAWDYFTQARAAGFSEAEPLRRYMDLRAANPRVNVPPELPGATSDERLDHLQNHLQQGCTQQEAHA